MSSQSALQHVDGLKRLVRRLTENGAYWQAQAFAKRLAELVPNDPEVWYLFGCVQRELGENESAALCFSRSLDPAVPGGAPPIDLDMITAKIYPGPSSATALGLSFLRQGRYDEAIECFKRIEKDFAATYYNMGLAFFMGGRFKDAVVNLQRVCEIDSADADGLNLLGQAFDNLGEYGPAETHLRRAIEVAPDYADAHYDLGNMFLKIKGKRREAKTLLERALTLDPDMMWGYYCLGCWYALAGKKAKAFDYLEMAIEKGFKDRAWIEADKDLDSLRGDPRYTKVLAKFKKKSGEEAGEKKNVDEGAKAKPFTPKKANQAKKAKKAAAKGKEAARG